MPFEGIFKGVDAAASAMGAERLRMDVAAENLAHAGSTKPLEDGLPYKRQRVTFNEVLDAYGKSTGGVDAEVVESPRYLKRFDPDHPHADPETGMVTEAEIDPILELTDMIIAGRSFDANSNAVRGLMRMHESALRLGEQ